MKLVLDFPIVSRVRRCVPDVPLPNQDPSMMDALGQAQLVHTSLQSPLQEILHLEREHVIELHAGFIKHTHTNETANQGVSFEETIGVLFLNGEQLTASRSSRLAGA